MPMRNTGEAEGWSRLYARDHFSAARLPLNAKCHLLNGDRNPHDHDFWEAVLILGGTGRHASVHGERPVVEGDAFLLRPGTWHRYGHCEGLIVYNCCFGVDLVRRELAILLREPALNYLLFTGPLSTGAGGMLSLRLEPERLETCRGLLDAISAADALPDSLSAVEKVGYLLPFLSCLARAVAGKLATADGPRERVHAAVPIVMRLLEEDLSREWTLNDLAEQVHLEPSYCVRVFRSGTGLSPLAYLARCRAERAASLLLRTTLPIGEIAQRTGWPDPNYFARRFRVHFGMSATAYRTQFSADQESPARSSSPPPRAIRSS